MDENRRLLDREFMEDAIFAQSRAIPESSEGSISEDDSAPEDHHPRLRPSKRTTEGLTVDVKEEEEVHIDPLNIVAWLKMLSHHYSERLLIALFFTQHLLKGFAYSYCLTALDFLLREYGVSGPRMQLVKGIIMLPWALKPICGLLSDIVPIWGYRKMPYMLFSSLLGVTGLFTVAIFPASILTVNIITISLFMFALQTSVCDLLTEAKYAEKLKENPKHGPDLMTYVWAGLTIGSILSTATSGVVIAQFGPRFAYFICLVPGVLCFYPILNNYLDETRESTSPPVDHQSSSLSAHTSRELFDNQPEIVFLAVEMAFFVLLLATVGMIHEDITINFSVAICVAFAVGISFTMLLRPIIGLMNLFVFVQTSLALSIDGATFYFFTNNESQYPNGPHFSIFFYTTGIGLVAGLFNLIGLFIYNRYMKNFSYHSLFYGANILVFFFNLCSIALFTRYNLQIGIPDHAFVLSNAVLQSVVMQWMWVPSVVLMSQVCPRGLEASMYALLAGCHNVGNTIASYAGAYMLKSFGVSPSGKADEGGQFDQLWKCALIAAVLPALTLILLPWCIPNKKQTEKILIGEDGDDETPAPGSGQPPSSHREHHGSVRHRRIQSATIGSPWNRLKAKWFPPGEERSQLID